MKNELIMFEEREILGKDFKMYGTIDNPLFLANEVAEWIDYSDGNASHMCSMVDDDEKVKIFCNIINSSNGTKQVVSTGLANRLFLTEDGLYEVLMQSRKPIAKEFKKEVKKILKQIRKTGGFIPVSEEDSDLMIMSKALLIMQKTVEKKDELLELQQPKVQAYESLMDSRGDLDFNEFVKSADLKIGRNKLFDVLRNELIIRQKPSTEPYERYRKQGYFKVIQVTNGFHSTSKTLITKKGVDWLMKKCFEWDIVNLPNK